MSTNTKSVSKIAVTLVLGCAVLTACGSNLKESPNEESAGQYVQLFDGDDLSEWVVYGDDKWYIGDRWCLVYENGHGEDCGCLATIGDFDDFDLYFEFRQLGSGSLRVFFRSSVTPTVRIHGWGCEISRNSYGICKANGRRWLEQIPGEDGKYLNRDGWNILRLRVEGDHVQTWLNSIPLANVRDRRIKAGKGKIVLQIQNGEEVLWRNINLTTL